MAVRKSKTKSKNKVDSKFKYALMTNTGIVLNSSISNTREELWKKQKDEVISELDNDYMYDSELLEKLILDELRIVKLEIVFKVFDVDEEVTNG